jgi:hypothetical protein
MTTREVAFFFALLMCISALWSFIYFILIANSMELSEKYKLFEFASEKHETTSSETGNSNNDTNTKERKIEPATLPPS